MQNWLIPLHLKLSLCSLNPLGESMNWLWRWILSGIRWLAPGHKAFEWELVLGLQFYLGVLPGSREGTGCSWGYRSSNSQPNHQAFCCQPMKDMAKGGRLFFWADGVHQAALWPLPITEEPNQRLCPLSCKGVIFGTIMRKLSITCSVVICWKMSKFCKLTSTNGILPTWITSPNCTSPFPFVA